MTFTCKSFQVVKSSLWSSACIEISNYKGHTSLKDKTCE
jgi:hypothetical protein